MNIDGILPPPKAPDWWRRRARQQRQLAEFEGFAVQRWAVVGSDAREIARFRGTMPDARDFARLYARQGRQVVLWELQQWLRFRPRG